MAYKNLVDFIKNLEREGELYRISCFADPILEISEICDRISKSTGGGKALLFTDTGTDFPVLINSMGSYNRMCMALGVKDLNFVATRMEAILKDFGTPRENLFSKIGLLPKLGKLSGYFPSVHKGRAECQEVIIKDPDLGILPVLKTWPYDGGRFITLPIVHTIDAETGARNAGMYRMQIFNKNTTGMHWHRHKTGARHYEQYKKLNKMMPVAVALGGDPVYTYAATAPLPDNMDEYLFAGFLREKSVKMVKCITQDIEVPADTDIIIEGYVNPAEDKVIEGPFGDHTGFYSLEDYYPVFHVTCITHRKNAVYPATIVGIPPQEDAWIAKATERIFLFPVRQTVVPELIDMEIPESGVAHNLTIVKINKTYPGQPSKVMNALWGAGQMMFNKVLIVADESVDIKNSLDLLSALRKIDPVRDIHFSTGPLDVLDHSTEITGFGGKMGIDLCRKSAEEIFIISYNNNSVNEFSKRGGIEEWIITEKIIKAVGEMKGIALFTVNKKGDFSFSEFCSQITESENYSNCSFFMLTDENVDLEDSGEFIWFILNNIDPIRDIKVWINKTNKSFLCIDGTSKTSIVDKLKKPWPNILVMDTVTINKVDKRWAEYDIGEYLDSPSKKFSRLVKNEGAAIRRHD
jgi:4-hydroxy-3-polyprenylbenzoate decarboxylase